MLSGPGFAVVAGPFAGSGLDAATAQYERAISGATPEDVKLGRESIRVNGLLARAPCLSAIFTHEPLLTAAAELIGGPFKLSAFHARSIRPGAAAQALHQDVAPGQDGWPLLGFIFMVDPFVVDNGATRFLPRSQDIAAPPPAATRRCLEGQYGCGPAGSMIVFDGSVWHGHSANRTSDWRRSIQGALIPKSATGAVDHQATLPPACWADLPPLARSLLLR